MNEFMHWLQGTMETPTLFGWFHILWIGILLAECVVIFIFKKKMSRKTVNLIILLTGIALLIFELYKQLIYSFRYNDGDSYWKYRWYAFPFQFCSTPMYLMFLAGLLRKGKVYDSLLCYLATFALFGGITVIIYPTECFVSTIGINIQTMFWHTSMIAIGFLVLATKSVDINLKSVAKATVVFVIMVAMALGMDFVWHFVGVEGQTFNMFYISPYFKTGMPVLSTIQQSAPYPVFLLLYIIGFVLAALLMMLIAMLFVKWSKTRAFKRMTPDERAYTIAIETITKEL